MALPGTKKAATDVSLDELPRHLRLKSWAPTFPGERTTIAIPTQARSKASHGGGKRRRRGKKIPDPCLSSSGDESDGGGHHGPMDDYYDPASDAGEGAFARAVAERENVAKLWENNRETFKRVALESTELLRSPAFELPGKSDIEAACRCTTCLECGSSNIEPASRPFADVLYVTCHSSARLKVPLYHCRDCAARRSSAGVASGVCGGAATGGSGGTDTGGGGGIDGGSSSAVGSAANGVGSGAINAGDGGGPAAAAAAMSAALSGSDQPSTSTPSAWAPFPRPR